MKKIKIIFSIFCFCFTMISCTNGSTMLSEQTPPPEYISMIISYNQWNELAENISLPPEYQYQRTYITKIGSDTLISGVSYYKLLTAKDELSSIWLNNGYIRENTETRKVYYKPQKDEQEILLYNFNVFDMQVGNEFQSYDIQSKTNVLLSVKRVEYDNIGGKNRMIATIRSISLDVNCVCYEDHIWIEGIGNINGFLRSTMAIQLNGSDKMSLLCFLQNEELVYKPENTNIEDCFVYKLTSSNIETEDLIVYQNAPNPFDKNTTIRCFIPKNMYNVQLCVYNIQGAQVQCLNVYEKGTVDVIIEAGKLTSGIYTYLLIGDGKTSEAKNMILTK